MRKDSEYYYFRCGKLHQIKPYDFAVDLTEEETVLLKEGITANNEAKKEILKGFWAHLVNVKGRKPYHFD